MFNDQLSPAENELLVHLLNKELEETRMEFHHARNNDYKQFLREREEMIRRIMTVVAKADKIIAA